MVSILVAAWNEADVIERHIRSVLALRYPNREYVLCAGGTDGTLETARRYAGPGVIVLEQRPGEGKQRALQRALDDATGEVVYFTDADCLVDDESFRQVLAPLLEDGAAAATGGSRPIACGGALCSLAALQYFRELFLRARAGEWSVGLLGRNCAVRRDVLEVTGALAQPARTGTDYRLARTLLGHGYRIRTVVTSAVATTYPCGPRDYFWQQSRWLRNLFVHGVATGDWSQTLHAVTTAFAGAFILGGLPWLRWRGSLGAMVWSVVIWHAALARARQIGVGLHVDRCGPPARFALVAPGWLVLDAVVWLAAPIQLLSARARARW